MKMAEILRKFADLIDQTDEVGADLSGNSTHRRMDVVDAPEPELDPSPLMIPPLQAKLEILKKSEGLPNVYGEGEQEDELNMMKKRAGLKPSQHEASEDNDVVG